MAVTTKTTNSSGATKPYPGCAYVDTTVDALLELGPSPAGDVAAVVIEASVLTCEMDALSRQHTRDSTPTPWLAAHHRELTELASRVSLRHNWALTLRTGEAMAPLLPLRATTAGTSSRRLLGAVRRIRRQHHGIRFAAGDGMALLRALRDGGIGATRRAATAGPLWEPAALAAFAMTFPARVRVTLRDGRELVAQCDVPVGGAGSNKTSPDIVSRQKLSVCGPPVWGRELTDDIAEAIDADADDLWRLLGTSE